ncbi:MAG: lipoyl(octanoyl) transferase LipB [Bacteroidetes bacterium]|nr:lipoyl(octanoyl) transferase LipB [Bacteroidota bacterium]
MQKVLFQDLAVIDYKEAWDYQEKLFNATIANKISNRNAQENEQIQTQSHLLFCEHPHVYTLGKSGSENNLLINSQQLTAHEATFYKINRGGDITYHGPGQIVGYPILDLDNFFTDIHKYLRYLEEVIIDTLAEFTIKAGRIAGLTGVWVDYENPSVARKICAMGVRTSRWVTMHGFALNVNTDISYFNNIVPCGITDKAVTSMHLELQQKVDATQVKTILKEKFAKRFDCVLKDSGTAE